MLRCVAGVPAFDPEAGPPGYTYAKVADHVALRIAAKTDDPARLAPGAMLPGEREMAEQYGVAIGTIRRAVEELRDRGLVVTLPAKGTYVARQTDS
jgi:GntR family transcriptional regulator